MSDLGETRSGESEGWVRVVLVDDQDLVRSGLRRILRRKVGFEVVAECIDGAGVEAAVDCHRPDLVVMDLRMKGVDGIEATRRLRARGDEPPVLVLTTFDDDELLSGALRAGAAGFVLKDAPAEELIQAAQAVAGGEAWLDPAVTGRVLSTYRRAVPARQARSAVHDDLTPRELEVLRLIGRGLTNAQIAATLYISELTVKSHVGHIFAKLGLRDRVTAVIYAFDHGIVTPGEAADPALDRRG
jgi:DNA-binding NarL/FixJ family response regulator